MKNTSTMMRDTINRSVPALLVVAAVLGCATIPTYAADKKPNILVIWGDDVGITNISDYNLGVMGYKTPNMQGSSLNAASINYNSVQAMQAMQRLKELESLSHPSN